MVPAVLETLVILGLIGLAAMKVAHVGPKREGAHTAELDKQVIAVGKSNAEVLASSPASQGARQVSAHEGAALGAATKKNNSETESAAFSGLVG